MPTLPITTIILAEHLSKKLAAAMDSVHWSEQILIVTRNPDFPKKSLGKQVRVYVVNSELLDFAQLRNQALSQVQTEWVFYLDSDEVCDPRAEAQLTPVLNQPEVAAYQCLRRDFFLGREMKWGELRHVWIARLARTKTVQWHRPVHEVMTVQGQVVACPLVISHFSHDSIADFLKKVIGYAQLEAKDRQQRGVRVSSTELFVWPLGKFLQNYWLRLGFLDGWQGLVYAVMMSIHSFTVRALLYEKTHN